jgi:hypothetical protein
VGVGRGRRREGGGEEEGEEGLVPTEWDADWLPDMVWTFLSKKFIWAGLDVSEQRSIRFPCTDRTETAQPVAGLLYRPNCYSVHTV